MKQTFAFALFATLAVATPLSQPLLSRDSDIGNLTDYRRIVFNNDLTQCLSPKSPPANGVTLGLGDCAGSDLNPHGVTIERTSAAWLVQISLVTDVVQPVPLYLESADGQQLCLDAGSPPIANGNEVHMWQCYEGLAQQQWKFTTSGQLALADGSKCLDLTSGTRDRVQVWDCSEGDGQQIFSTNDFPEGIFDCIAGQPCDSS